MFDVLASFIQGGLSLLLSLTAAPSAPQALVGTLDLTDRVPAQEQVLDEPPSFEIDLREEPAPPMVTAPLVPPTRNAWRQMLQGNVLFVPEGFHSDDGSFDLIIHFNGAPQTVESAITSLGFNAVLYTVNLGIGSGVYEQRFADEHVIDRTILGVEQLLQAHWATREVKAGRVALTAWSAGYGAIVRTLRFSRVSSRVDAVLLADGMHAGFDQTNRTKVSEASMAPFVRYARRAASGEVLMGISHSEIGTRGYASTTQTADALLGWLGIERAAAEPLALKSSHALTRADQHGLHVMGFSGNGPDAHCDHLLEMDRTLFPLLRARWGGMK